MEKIMNQKNLFTKTIDGAGAAAKSVTDIYDRHIRKKAIELVEQKLEIRGLNSAEIALEDYEAMVSDNTKDIQKEYTKKMAQSALAVLGLDLLMGL